MSFPGFDQIKNETDMLNLSQSDLLKYHQYVSSLVNDEISTIKGLDDQRAYYQNVVDTADRNITNLDIAISISTLELSYQKGEVDKYGRESSILAAQIASTLSAISIEDNNIITKSKYLSTLLERESTLTGEIKDYENKFEKDAEYYSTLYRQYISAAEAYDTLLTDVNTASSILISSIAAAEESERDWEIKNSTLKGLERQYSSLVESRFDLEETKQDLEISIVNQTQVVLSTAAAVKQASSLWEVALTNQEYVRTVSDQVAAYQEYSDSQNTFDRYSAYVQARVSGSIIQTGGQYIPGTLTDEQLAALSDAELSNEIQKANIAKNQKWSNFTTKKGKAESLEAQLKIQEVNAFETTVEGIDTIIEYSYSTMYMYNYKKNLALKREAEYKRKRDEELSSMKGYQEESTAYGLAYVSSFAAYTTYNSLKQGLANDKLNAEDELFNNLESAIDSVEKIMGEGFLPLNVCKQKVSENKNRSRDQRLQEVLQSAGGLSLFNPNDYIGGGSAQGGARDEYESILQQGGQTATLEQQLMKELTDISFILSQQGDSLEGGVQEENLFKGPADVFDENYQFQSATPGEVGGYTSSILGYQRISTLAGNAYNASSDRYNKYNDEYASVAIVVARLEGELSDATFDLDRAKRESSYALQTIAKLEAKKNKDLISLFIDFNIQEKATYEYRETYIREAKVEANNQYENAIRAEIQRISSTRYAELAALGDISTVVNISQAIDLNSESIRAPYNEFQQILTALGYFNTIYNYYDNRGTVLNTFSNYAEDFVSSQSGYTDLYAAYMLPTPPDQTKIPILREIFSNIQVLQGRLGTYDTTLKPINTQIDNQKIVIKSSLNAHLKPKGGKTTEERILEMEDLISTFIKAGFSNAGASGPTAANT